MAEEEKQIVISVFRYDVNTHEISWECHPGIRLQDLVIIKDLVLAETAQRALLSFDEMTKQIKRLEELTIANSTGVAALLREVKNSAQRKTDEVVSEITKLSGE